MFFEFVGLESFGDFGFGLLFFLEVFLDVNQGVISGFFIVVDFGGLLDLE